MTTPQIGDILHYYPNNDPLTRPIPAIVIHAYPQPPMADVRLLASPPSDCMVHGCRLYEDDPHDDAIGYCVLPRRPEDDKTIDEAQSRYNAACHGMQTGVKMLMEKGDAATSPKHLRVGVNYSMVETSALVGLLVDLGVITKTEFTSALASSMEQERDKYQQMVNAAFNSDNIKLA